jgi:drug/metabolite transporter (DMT)-like permease
MSGTAFILILLSVVLHVGWNFLCKANKHPNLAFYFVANLLAALLLTPLLFVARLDWLQLDWRFWLAVFFSDFFEAIYSIGLFKAYSKNDISLVYPMARALPVLMIPIVTLSFGIGSIPNNIALAGMAVVAIGCIIMPQERLSDLNWRMLLSRSMLPIVTAAIGTTGYTLMDKIATAKTLAISASPRIVTLGAYLCIIQFGIALFILVYMLAASDEGWRDIRSTMRSPGAYLCGVFSFSAYFLVLGAMGFVSNVSYLQAFRQMSLPLGVFAGVWFLNERLTLPKIFGTIMVVAGLLLTVI